MDRSGIETADVVVIGAGIVGLATALALLLEGRDVLLVDRAAPASQCSRGNAGILAVSEVFPVASINRLLNVPRLLFDPLGPLTVRGKYALNLLPWVSGFVKASFPSSRKLAIAALAEINRKALAAYRRLLTAANAGSLLIERGMLSVAPDPEVFRRIRGVARSAEEHGVSVDVLNGHQVCDLEPVISDRIEGGVLFSDVAHVSDPYDVARALLSRFVEGGGRFLRDEVMAIRAAEGSVQLTTETRVLQGAHIVVAAGVSSRELLQHIDVSLPVESERGYHLHLPEPGPVPSRPLMFPKESFVATPLASGLRLAGTSEFAGRFLPPDWRRSEMLLPLAQRYLPEIAASGAAHWMGHRATFPDSLPVIGRLPGMHSVICATGHQHLGLTLAAITGYCVADLVAGRKSSVNLKPFSLLRFGR